MHEASVNKTIQNRSSHETKNRKETEKVPRSGVGFSPRKIGCVGGPLPKTLTLFKTKICDFPYPIYDLTKNSIPHVRPDPSINTLFQTCLIISYLVQTDVIKRHCEGLLLTVLPIMKIKKNSFF